MPQPRRDGARFAVRFDDLLFDEDLAHATQAGQHVARQARRRLERDGASPRELALCQAEHRKGTRLPNCLKTYLPEPGGRWRMIFELTRHDGQLVLAYLAFGVGHPEHAWQLSAYQVAHHRLHHHE
jgi:hypothetical protein